MLEFKTSTTIELPDVAVVSVRRGSIRPSRYGEILYGEETYGSEFYGERIYGGGYYGVNLDDFLSSLEGLDAADTSVRGR